MTGWIFLFVGVVIVVAIALELRDWSRRPVRNYDAEAAHRGLMAELDRIADEAASRHRHPTGRDQ
jgi:hypothetical protein